jgi:Ca-activated chloride channel family protein
MHFPSNVQQRFSVTRCRGRTNQQPLRSIPAVPRVLAIAIISSVAFFALPARLWSQRSVLFHERVDLVNVGVTVVDRRHHLIAYLGAGDFAVYEDGKPQTIRAFAVGAQTGPPLHVGVLLDVSGSQQLDLPFTQAAATKFLRSLTDAVDMTFIDFATEVKAAQYPPSDFPLMVEHVQALKAEGFTSLYDAIGVYLDRAADQDGRKVMVLYTDGDDNRSVLTLSGLTDMLKASDATVYTIGAFENQPEFGQAAQREILKQIAEATGGAAFFPGKIRDLDRIYQQILGEVRAQYTIGYLSSNEKADGAWRHVEIRIIRPDGHSLRVRARKGYYAPSKP